MVNFQKKKRKKKKMEKEECYFTYRLIDLGLQIELELVLKVDYFESNCFF